MEQTLHTPENYDFRRYDRVWQRVAPQMEPYPGMGPAPEEGGTEGTSPAQTTDTAAMTPAQARQEAQLPGAERNPCCMGSAAAEMTMVLTGFIEAELEDRRYYLTMLRCAPAWARQALRTIADDEGGHARRLSAVYYLITGQCYQPTIPCGAVTLERWCPALRRRYHEEACGAFNYARAADGTTDVCLQRIFQELSADEYRHANTISALLERSLQLHF